MVRGPKRGGDSQNESAEARAERRARSLEEPLDVRVTGVDPYPALEVRNPIHRTSYRVLLPEYPSEAVRLCTCTDFARRGLGTCKHLEAALRWLRSRPGELRVDGAGPRERSTDVWREVDRRQEAAGPAERRRGRDLAVVGEALLG